MGLLAFTPGGHQGTAQERQHEPETVRQLPLSAHKIIRMKTQQQTRAPGLSVTTPSYHSSPFLVPGQPTSEERMLSGDCEKGFPLQRSHYPCKDEGSEPHRHSFD